MSSRVQRERVAQFCAITGAPERVAARCLAAADWTVEGAIELFFAEPQDPGPRLDNNAILRLFQRYQAPGHDAIMADGVGRFCDDLKVDAADPVMLVLSWHFSAEVMCEYSREEFTTGMAKLGCDSIEALRQKLPALRQELSNESKFREIYEYAYSFCRERGQKCVHLDTAIGMWQLLFAGRPWPHIEAWCEFLQQHHKHAISKDTWLQLFEFSKSVKPDFSNFDENGAWPFLIDEFVERMQEQQAANSRQSPQ